MLIGVVGSWLPGWLVGLLVVRLLGGLSSCWLLVVVLLSWLDLPCSGVGRLSLKNLQRFVSDKLQPAKWPQLIVYMDDAVKTTTNKVQRVGLANRMVWTPHTH